MKHTRYVGRALLTVGILGAICLYASPAKMAEILAKSDWRWLLAMLALMPVFLFCRIFKWYLLVRQFVPQVNVPALVSGYLWGLALGLVTPGRMGEAYRVWGAGLPSKHAGLFVVEKGVELLSLMILCTPALLTAQFLPRWFVGAFIVAAAVSVLFWRAIALRLLPVSDRILQRMKLGFLTGADPALRRLRLSGCLMLSCVCPALFLIQAYLALRGMGERPEPLAIALFPIVLLSNLVPVTVGGIGLREATAVLLLKPQGLTEAAVLNSFLLVTLVNLALPCVLAGLLRHLKPALLPKGGPEAAVAGIQGSDLQQTVTTSTQEAS
ncbi:MAG: flippase-like domain-containing protein [Phycisphaerae bacterium]|nr:flippase-like domain-containing protein [Phycisphaerae bacterium]